MSAQRLQTCKSNRTPAQGSAAWTGSYWTAASPTCLKRSIHLMILPNRSDIITISPVFRVYRHFFLMHSCFACSVNARSSDKMFSLLDWLRLMLLLSPSLSLAAASAQRSLLSRSEVSRASSGNGAQSTYALGPRVGVDAIDRKQSYQFGKWRAYLESWR